MQYDNKISLILDANSKNEAFARVSVSAFATQLDPTLEQLDDIKMAVSEAVTNAIIHGYEGIDNGEIYIADRYSNKIIEGYPINSYECLGTQLKCLKYGRNVLPIQSNVLENLSTEKIRKLKESEEEEEEVQ